MADAYVVLLFFVLFVGGLLVATLLGRLLDIFINFWTSGE